MIKHFSVSGKEEYCQMDNANQTEYKYLGGINSPEDVKKLSDDEAILLCGEIRKEIISSTIKNGGHLASNLGVVELSVAIHRVFDCPHDHVIFDVGHQSYAHKLLTGRFKTFDSLRQAGGISGFTNRSESEYDCFGAGHSSTSLSAALGFAEADRIMKNDAYTVVVLGDGAFTGGMIHEALNNCNKDIKKLIIILNENEMSISKNIGRFAASIAKLRKKNSYFKVKKFTVAFVKKVPLIGCFLFRAIRDTKKAVKNALYGSTYFEDLGLYYLGPTDGNDLKSVEALLNAAKNANESVIVHLKTQKGKGYIPAEENPGMYHGVAPIDAKKSASTFSNEFGKTICDLAEKDERICAITAAMSTGTGLDQFEGKFADRFFDVGIAEEHAVTFASGLSANGMIPVFAVYSTFLQRSYDQIIHDAALQSLPVILCIDRAGFNNSDGATHHGIFDVSFLSEIPNIRIYTPVSYRGLSASLYDATLKGGVCAIRYPSGGEEELIVSEFYKIGHNDCIGIRANFKQEDAPDNIIITHGRIAKECIIAKQILEEKGIRVGIILCEYIAPYDVLAKEIESLLSEIELKSVTFVEEEIRAGGFGMNLSDKMVTFLNRKGTKYSIMAAENAFVKLEEGESYLSRSGLDGRSIAARIDKTIN